MGAQGGVTARPGDISPSSRSSEAPRKEAAAAGVQAEPFLPPLGARTGSGAARTELGSTAGCVSGAEPRLGRVPPAGRVPSSPPVPIAQAVVTSAGLSLGSSPPKCSAQTLRHRTVPGPSPCENGGHPAPNCPNVPQTWLLGTPTALLPPTSQLPARTASPRG